MNTKKFLSLITAALIFTLQVGCGDKKGETTTVDLSVTETTTSVSSDTLSTENESDSDNTDDSENSSDDTAETVTEIVTETDTNGSVVTNTNGTPVTKTVIVTSTKTNSDSSTKTTTTTKKNNNSNKTTTTKKNSSQNQSTTAKTTKKQDTTTQKTTQKTTVQQTTKPETTVATELETEAEDNGVFITLSDSGIKSDSNAGVSISSSVVTITQEGKYTFSGTLSNGQIIVNAPKDAKVNIHLNGASISSSSSAPIYVMSADTCVIHLDDGSTNYVSDTSSNALSACIFSKDDLTFKGGGSLTIVGNKKHAVKSSNDIKIKNGTLNISSVSTALYGDDSVWMTGGNVIVYSCKDGIKAANEEDSSKGFVQIDGGYVDIQNASGNGIEAVTGITISGGAVNVHSEKKALKCDAQSINASCYCEY